MRIVIAAQGRIKSRELRTLLEDYAQRVKKYAKYEECEFEDSERAGQAMAKLVHDRARLITLEVHGKATSSEGLAKLVERAETDAIQDLIFAIGGAYGLPKEIKARTHYELSLSQMILPHRLARLFVLEQVYRAFTISRGEPYSHA